MSTKPSDAHDRLPTAGPSTDEYDQYAFVQVDDDVILYDEQHEDAWIQSSTALTLEDWR